MALSTAYEGWHHSPQQETSQGKGDFTIVVTYVNIIRLCLHVHIFSTIFKS